MRRLFSVAVATAVIALLWTAADVCPQGFHPEGESVCMYNHFSGIVYDCDHNPAQGETVTLRFPDGSTETDVTNSEGKYCFAKPIPIPGGTGWEPGYYGLETRCNVKLVYRAGDGDIDIDLSVCCPKPGFLK
jgi:hypothetical protein